VREPTTGREVFGCVGFFGQPNFGDELLCRTVTDLLRRNFPTCSLEVFTNSAVISHSFSDIRGHLVEGAYPWPELYRNLREHITAIARSDLVVIGGGGLINDYYSWSAIPRFLLPACMALVFQKPFVFVGLGVVGVRRKWLRRLVSFAFRNAAAIYCRDHRSLEKLAALAGDRPRPIVAPDIALAIDLSLASTKEGAGSTNYILLNFREYPPFPEELLVNILTLCLNRSPGVVLLATESSDARWYAQVVSRLTDDQQCRVEIVLPDSLGHALALIVNANHVIAERLHVTLVAAIAGRLLLSVEYEHKVSALLDELGIADRGRRIANLCVADVAGSLDSAQALPSLAITQLRSRVETAFRTTIARGLEARQVNISFLVRFEALIHVAVFGSLGALWAFAVTVKRALFGRTVPRHPASQN
jgi:polysaccharide pyruvyl transferase WcaK-like protein